MARANTNNRQARGALCISLGRTSTATPPTLCPLICNQEAGLACLLLVLLAAVAAATSTVLTNFMQINWALPAANRTGLVCRQTAHFVVVVVVAKH